MLGTKMEAAALLLTPPTPEGRDPPSLRPKPNPKKNLKAFEVVQGQTATWRKTRRDLFDTHADPAVKELGKAQCKSPSIPNNQIGTNQVNWPEMVIA